MSLTPKIDEVREFIIRNEVDLALIAETWLKESVSDCVVDIPEFTLLVEIENQKTMEVYVLMLMRHGININDWII